AGAVIRRRGRRGIGATGGALVLYVAHRRHPRDPGYLLALQPVRVARSIEALVMMERGVGDRLGIVVRLEELVAALDMLAHQPELDLAQRARLGQEVFRHREDRKSTRLNSSHVKISYAGFCLQK